MTLLESVLALAILGLTSTGILGVYQNALKATRASAEWLTGVAYAESVMESTKTGAHAGASTANLPGGFQQQVTNEAIPGTSLRRVRVVIIFPDQREYIVERIAAP